MLTEHGDMIHYKQKRAPKPRRVLRCPCCRVGFSNAPDQTAETSLELHLHLCRPCLLEVVLMLRNKGMLG